MVRKRKQLILTSSIDGKTERLPINFSKLQDLMEELYKQYPDKKKSEISKILICFFEEVRRELLLGKSLNFSNFLINMRAYPYLKLKNDKIQPNITIQISTPKKFQNEF